MYPNPGAFKPERFLREGKLNPAVMDPNIAAFGFGRRSVLLFPLEVELNFCEGFAQAKTSHGTSSG